MVSFKSQATPEAKAALQNLQTEKGSLLPVLFSCSLGLAETRLVRLRACHVGVKKRPLNTEAS